MGQLVTTIAGGVIGFYLGGPMGAQIGMMLGGMIGATLFGPTVHGPRLNDLKVTASTYGVAIPEIYGTVRVGGNLIWTSGIREIKKSSRPGKGGPKQVTYSYDATFAMGLCKGPIDDVLRIWADSKLIYDKTNGTTRNPVSGGNGSVFSTLVVQLINSKKKKKKRNVNLRLYHGTEDQLPDSLIEANKGVGNVSAHRGLAYVVFERMALENFGNRIPQMTFEVTKARTRGLLALPAREASMELEGTENRDWLPDFASGRVLSFSKPADEVKAYNLETMTELVRNGELNFNISERTYSLISGANRLVVGNYPAGVGFSVYNTATLSQISQHNLCSGLTNQRNASTGAITLSTTGRIGHARYLTGGATGTHIIHTDWQGKTFVMDDQGRLLNQVDAPFLPNVFLETRQDRDTSQIVGWRGANNRLEMFVVETPGSARHETIVEGGSSTWVPATGITIRSVELRPFPLEKFTPLVVLYDPTDDHIFCLGVNPDEYNRPNDFNNGGGVTVFKYSLTTNSYKFITAYDTVPAPRNLTQNMRSSRLAGGTFGWIAKPRIGVPVLTQINLQSGAIASSVTTDDEFGQGFATASDQFWDDETDTLFTSRTASGVTNSYRLAVNDNVQAITVPAIVEDVCLRSGVLTPDDLDLSELDNSPIIGYSMDRLTTGRDALKQMATAFLFDAYESDYKLKFRSRGGDPITDIPEDWMARDGNDRVVEETITQELEMPLRIVVNYYDVARDHQQSSQTAKRKVAPYPTMWTSKEDVVELPITWDADSAKQCADKLLKMAWANRTGYQFGLPWRYLKYDPTDVVTVTMEDGTIYNVRLTEANIGADFTVECKAVSEVATAYVSSARGAVGEAPPQTLDGDGSAFPYIINTPLLRDLDFDTSGLSTCYISAGTNEVTFNGTAVYMDNGTDFQAVGVINGQTVSGYAVTALPDTLSYESMDEETVLRVRLSDPSMELESITQDDLLNLDMNAALVGDEIIQFREAYLLPTGEWALSGLLRARRGTNYAVRGHIPGERFLMLDTESTAKFTRPPESYFTTRLFKAAPLSVSLADVVATSATLVPRDLMPYTPEAVKITDNGTDVTVSAQRRSRVTAGLQSSIGTIHYKEGDMLSARIVTKVWVGKSLSDIAGLQDPDTTITSPLFNAAGQDVPVAASFPLAALGSADTILVQLTEIGEVEGTPKWVEARRFGQGDWNLTEFY